MSPEDVNLKILHKYQISWEEEHENDAVSELQN